MAQAAMAASDRTLHLIEKRARKIRKLAHRLDSECWYLERAVDRLGVNPWDGRKDQGEIAAEIIERWLDGLEANLCMSDATGH